MIKYNITENNTYKKFSLTSTDINTEIIVFVEYSQKKLFCVSIVHKKGKEHLMNTIIYPFVSDAITFLSSIVSTIDLIDETNNNYFNKNYHDDFIQMKNEIMTEVLSKY